MAERMIIPARLRNLFDWTCTRCAAVFTTHAAPSGYEWSCVACGHRAKIETFFIAAHVFMDRSGRSVEEMARLDPLRTPADRAVEHLCRRSREPFITYDAPNFCAHCGERVAESGPIALSLRDEVTARYRRAR